MHRFEELRLLSIQLRLGDAHPACVEEEAGLDLRTLHNCESVNYNNYNAYDMNQFESIEELIGDSVIAAPLVLKKDMKREYSLAPTVDYSMNFASLAISEVVCRSAPTQPAADG
jgi:hypothetical protein